MWPALFVQRLLNNHGASIDQAHDWLLKRGYTLIGFHGCGRSDAIHIVPNKFKASKAGSNTGGGLARGTGFYVGAYYSNLAVTWAGIRHGKGFGAPTVLRVYVKGFPFLLCGLHYDWGAMDGINLRDATLEDLADPDALRDAFDDEDMQELHSDLELVIRPAAYDRLVAIPAKGPGDQALLNVAATWKSKFNPADQPSLRRLKASRFGEAPF